MIAHLGEQVRDARCKIYDYVIMPDHIHLLLSVSEVLALEKLMQFIKGGSSFRLRKELGYVKEVWQRSFTVHRVEDRVDFLKHREYIQQNPVRAGLVKSAEEYEFSSAGAKARVQKARGTHG